MFELLGLIAVVSLLFGVVVDDELFRFANTLANFATVALVVWHQHHVRRQIEPEVKETAAVVKRQLGERNTHRDVHSDDYNGPDRRK